MQTAFAGSYADFVAWSEAIRYTHERRITLRVLDLDHHVQSELTPRFMDGQITGDVSRDISRILDVSFLDPSRAIHFEPNDPSEAPVHWSRMLQVGYSVRVPALDRWVTCYPFTGPVFDFDRTGAEVTIVAHGKERLSMAEAGKPRTFVRKTKKTTVVRQLLADAGETRMAIPDLATTIPEALLIARMDQRWAKAVNVTKSLNRELFYDGRGEAIMRQPVEAPVFTFDARTLMSEVTIDRDPEGLHNTWDVLGAKPKGSKGRLSATATLPDAHDLSSWSLRRNDQRRFLIERVENDNFKTQAEVNAAATKRRDDGMRLTTSYSFDSLPVPHLDDNDLVRVVTDDGTLLVRMKQWTLPLGLEGAPVMTVGSVRRTTKARRGRRRGPKGWAA